MVHDDERRDEMRRRFFDSPYQAPMNELMDLDDQLRFGCFVMVAVGFVAAFLLALVVYLIWG